MKPSLLLASLVALAFAAASPQALATAELDRKYALETVGFLKSYDNVDGLFSDYVSAAYKDYFSQQSRFVLQDLSKADTAFNKTKLPYVKVIEDSEILGQLARSTRSQSMIRTKIFKEGRQYRFSLEWMHSPQMEVMANDTFVLEEPLDGQAFGLGDIKGALHKSLDRMIAKVPFQGQVTGRDDSAVTVNIGANANLKKGDTLIVGTIDEVKKHPLLKAIVDWRVTRTGKLEVDEVDDRIAFCRVVEEETGRSISRYQKISQIIPRSAPEQPIVITEKKELEDQLEKPPTLGWVAGNLWMGSASRTYSTPSVTGKEGGGFLLGAKAESQIWLNREWFTELSFGYGFWSHTQKDIGSTASSSGTSASGNVTSWRVSAGYSYLITGDFFGPKGWLKLGYRSTSYSLPVSTAEQTAPLSFKSLLLSVGGDLPIRSGFGAQLNLDFGVLSGAGHPAGSGFPDTNGGSDVSFFIGGYYRLKPRITLRFGFDIQANGADLAGGGNASQKVISVAPAVLYYF